MEKVLGCLSKRARATFEEEMAYQSHADQDRIEKSQKEIAAVMVRLDDEGKLVLDS